MEWWHAVVLGLVEGITEYLPISSTGHLILASALMGLDETPQLKNAVDAFNIVIQGGAILAVLGLYWRRVKQMVVGGLGLLKIGPGDAAGLRLAINLLIAFVPAAVLGPLLDDDIAAQLFKPMPVLLALALGGVFMIALDRWRAGREKAGHAEEVRAEIHDLTPVSALAIGLLQCVAMWPGTSRSMMTISGGVLVGLKPSAAAEFSFLLGLPTLGGACCYKLAKNLYAADRDGTPNIFEVIGAAPILIGLLVATVSAAIAVKWLVGFLNRHGLAPFGWYRLALCAVLGGLIAAGMVRIEPPPEEAASQVDVEAAARDHGNRTQSGRRESGFAEQWALSPPLRVFSVTPRSCTLYARPRRHPRAVAEL